MAHNITERDGFFTVRQAAWHGLGTVLGEYPTIEEAKKIAHPWEPITEEIFRRVVEVNEEGELVEHMEPIENFVAKVRSDTNEVLGVTSETLETVNNSVMYDIAEAIEGEARGSVQLETGGSLLGGKKVWLLLKLRDPLMISDDPNGAVIPYYALQNAHDGSGSFRGQATMTRIVCDNTAQMADLDARTRGTEFTFSHTKGIHDRIEEARTALTGWRDSVRSYRQMMTHLRELEITREQQRTFLDAWMPLPMPNVATERSMLFAEKARETYMSILNGPTCEGIDLTVYGLVQASVEYLNYGRRAHTQATRFKRSYLTRDEMVSTAKELALSVAQG